MNIHIYVYIDNTYIIYECRHIHIYICGILPAISNASSECFEKQQTM